MDVNIHSDISLLSALGGWLLIPISASVSSACQRRRSIFPLRLSEARGRRRRWSTDRQEVSGEADSGSVFSDDRQSVPSIFHHRRRRYLARYFEKIEPGLVWKADFIPQRRRCQKNSVTGEEKKSLSVESEAAVPNDDLQQRNKKLLNICKLWPTTG